MSTPVYLDYNATTPYAEEVKNAIISSMNCWGNPSSSHALGHEAKNIIEESRYHVANMIGAFREEIIFTSGGTESNYTVIESAVKCMMSKAREDPHTFRDLKPHIITTNIEHDSICLHVQKLQDAGIIDATFLPVSKETGQVCADDIENLVRASTCLVTVMMANNETGIIQPVAEIGKLIEMINGTRHYPILFHTDASQAIGKIECLVKQLRVDFLTITGHKFYGPRIGALYVNDLHNKPYMLEPVFYGGGQENGYRAGTENTAMIAGLGKAAELVHKNLKKYQTHMLKVRDYAEMELQKTFGQKIVFNNKREKVMEAGSNKKIGVEVPRLPNTMSVAFHICNLSGSEILKRADGLCASTGAACHSSHGSISVLVNSGVDEALAKCTLRLSIGRETSNYDINSAIKCLLKATKC